MEEPIDAQAISKKTANSGQIKYSNPAIIRDNRNSRISLIMGYIPRSNGQEVIFKLETSIKNDQLSFAVDKKKSTPWLRESEARILIKELNMHLSIAQEDDGKYLIIKINNSNSIIGEYDPSEVAQALTHVLGQDKIIKHLQNIEMSEELLKALQIIIRFREMQTAVEELRNNLQQNVYDEAVYQAWCEKHSWIFGNAYIIKDNIRTISAGDKLDIILPRVMFGYRDFVELKRPNQQVLVEDSSHTNYFFSSEVSKAIGQCNRYIDVFHEEASKGLRDHPEIIAYHPRAIIIIGRSNDWATDKQKALHSLNSRLNGITIMTYDQLLAQGERLIEIINPPEFEEEIPF